MTVVIYHNPACGTSRNALALIRHAGIEPHVIDYQKCPPSRALLAQMIDRAGMSIRDALRVKGTPYDELGLGDPSLSDDQLLDAMLAHPILINRPIVVTTKGVKLCRPSDVVLDLLPDLLLADFIKDDGEPALRDVEIASDDPGLAEMLAAAQLPTGDLAEPGRTFFAYRTLSGALVGYAGYELYGADVLLRSLVVPAEVRGTGIGKAIVARLCRRAFDAGARRAWLMTTTAADFFEAIGFKRVERSGAPEAILDTRQAKDLCPASAVVLSRPIRL
ncbi:MAG: arsenic resistance N-acetyltransferase ArsN2 [Ancalomicrobiaceae bacterium]|nr:arsenic resistance N-acetyltransferase ArsN2 [Ancalomicrobiaceae bacterium]